MFKTEKLKVPGHYRMHVALHIENIYNQTNNLEHRDFINSNNFEYELIVSTKYQVEFFELFLLNS